MRRSAPAASPRAGAGARPPVGRARRRRRRHRRRRAAARRTGRPTPAPSASSLGSALGPPGPSEIDGVARGRGRRAASSTAGSTTQVSGPVAGRGGEVGSRSSRPSSAREARPTLRVVELPSAARRAALAQRQHERDAGPGGAGLARSTSGMKVRARPSATASRPRRGAQGVHADPVDAGVAGMRSPTGTAHGEGRPVSPGARSPTASKARVGEPLADGRLLGGLRGRASSSRVVIGVVEDERGDVDVGPRPPRSGWSPRR